MAGRRGRRPRGVLRVGDVPLPATAEPGGVDRQLSDHDDGNWNEDIVTFDVDQGVAVAIATATSSARHLGKLRIGQFAEFMQPVFHNFPPLGSRPPSAIAQKLKAHSKLNLG